MWALVAVLGHCDRVASVEPKWELHAVRASKAPSPLVAEYGNAGTLPLAHPSYASVPRTEGSTRTRIGIWTVDGSLPFYDGAGYS